MLCHRTNSRALCNTDLMTSITICGCMGWGKDNIHGADLDSRPY